MEQEERKKLCNYHLVHVHSYSTQTGVANDHQHVIMSVSGPKITADGSHIHVLKGRTDFHIDHWHSYEVESGPAQVQPDGRHCHYFQGVTSVDLNHSHPYSGVTGLTFDVGADDRDDDDDDDYNYMPTKAGQKYKYGHRE
ncbi:MAG: YmaF family protein [Veillonellales bacterium]